MKYLASSLLVQILVCGVTQHLLAPSLSVDKHTINTQLSIFSRNNFYQAQNEFLLPSSISYHKCLARIIAIAHWISEE